MSGVLTILFGKNLVELPNRYFTKLKDENPEKLKNYFSEHLPIGRMAQPNEIADLVCFLCSNRNNYMAGAIIPFDGGIGSLKTN